MSCFLICLSVMFAFAPESRNEIPAPAKAALEHADHLEVLSLDPAFQVEGLKGGFHGFRVLKTVVVTNSEASKKLISAFERAVMENQGVMAACFNPRHGLRASKGDKHEDFVICFECLQVRAYGEANREFLISKSAASAFEEALQK